jgi:NAD(P)H dehydrogenase (quinone)
MLACFDIELSSWHYSLDPNVAVLTDAICLYKDSLDEDCLNVADKIGNAEDRSLMIDDVHVLVTFYSRGGLTERIAVWLAEGAVQAGAKIRLRRARDIEPDATILKDAGWSANRDRMHEEYAAPTEADAAWADVLALGIPASTGSMSVELAAYLQRLGAGALSGKIGTGFTSGYGFDPQSMSALAALNTAMEAMGLAVLARAADVKVPSATDWELAHAQGHQIVAAASASRGKS